MSKFMRSALLISGSMISMLGAFGQGIEHTPSGAWLMADLGFKGGGPWAASLELHERTWGAFETHSVALIRPAIHRDLLPNLEAALGGTWLASRGTLGGPAVEWNCWEQLTLKGSGATWSWATRIRQEQRWIGDGKDVPATRANRLRVRVSGKHALNWGDGNWYATAFVEWWGSQDLSYRTSTFSRSWHSLSLGRSFDSGWNVRLAALHQRDAAGTGWRVSDLVQLSIHKTWKP